MFTKGNKLGKGGWHPPFSKYRRRAEELRRAKMSELERAIEDRAIADEQVTRCTRVNQRLYDEIREMQQKHALVIQNGVIEHIELQRGKDRIRIEQWFADIKIRFNEADKNFQRAISEWAGLDALVRDLEHKEMMVN